MPENPNRPLSPPGKSLENHNLDLIGNLRRRIEVLNQRIMNQDDKINQLHYTLGVIIETLLQKAILQDVTELEAISRNFLEHGSVARDEVDRILSEQAEASPEGERENV